MYRQLTLETSKEILQAARTRQTGRRAGFLVRWNLTRAALTGPDGRIIKDTILEKAIKFIEENLVEKRREDPDGKELWICLPLPGYNSTTYTIEAYRYETEIIIGDNCQYCSYGKLCSHCLAMLILSGATDLKITIRPVVPRARRG